MKLLLMVIVQLLSIRWPKGKLTSHPKTRKEVQHVTKKLKTQIQTLLKTANTIIQDALWNIKTLSLSAIQIQTVSGSSNIL